MKRIFFAISAFLIAMPVFSQWKEKPGNWEKVRMTRTTAPNPNWRQAYPLGNGRLAARAMCNIKSEKIFLNENTFWAGYPRDFTDPKALSVLKEVRSLLLAGKNAEADNKSKQLQSINVFPHIYTGSLFLDYDHGTSASNIENILNYDSAMVQLRYTVDGVRYSREMFISYPDEVMVIRLCADKSGRLNLTVRMDAIDIDNLKLPHKVWVEGSDTLVMQGFADYDFGGYIGDTTKMKFDARVKVSVTGGGCSASGSTLKIAGADTALLVLSIGTSYNGPFKHPSPYKEGLDPVKVSKGYFDPAIKKTYGQLLATHLKDYQGIFRRLWVEINRVGDNPGQRGIDFQYTRFEVLQASRGPNGYPMKLQGIWNAKNRPNWYDNYTLNSEGPKAYWTCEAGNFPEAIDPVTNFVEKLAVNGAKTAQINYGCRGWLAHHNSDMWAHTSMVGNKAPDFHPYWCCWMWGGAFMTQLMSDHYKFSGDVKYLKEHAYPMLKGIAQFCLDFLMDDGKGHLVPAPSTSPENMYRYGGVNDVSVCMASTGDMSLIRQTFLDVMEFSKVLNVDASFRDSVKAAYDKLLPFQIGSKGQLLEWEKEYVENEPGHRHASHLVGAFPLMVITARGTPEFWKAAKRSMELRGKGNAYLPSDQGMWARFLEGENSVIHLYKPNQPYGETVIFDGFTEMLLQSHAGELELLPALPAEFKSGKILGMRGRTGYEVDMEWENSKLTKTTIRSSLGTTPVVRIQGVLVPDPKNDPRITLEYLTAVAQEPFGQSITKSIALGRLSAIAIPYRGAYRVTVVSIRGQVVASDKGTGPATVRLVPRNWAPGLYVLKITAADGNITLVKKINTIAKRFRM